MVTQPHKRSRCFTLLTPHTLHTPDRQAVCQLTLVVSISGWSAPCRVCFWRLTWGRPVGGSRGCTNSSPTWGNVGGRWARGRASHNTPRDFVHRSMTCCVRGPGAPTKGPNWVRALGGDWVGAWGADKDGLWVGDWLHGWDGWDGDWGASWVADWGAAEVVVEVVIK